VEVFLEKVEHSEHHQLNQLKAAFNLEEPVHSEHQLNLL
jgi:hypothetical protein